MNGTDDDMAFIVAARINADVGAGAYSATYTQMAVTVTQTGSTTSIFGTWSELYIGGSGITAVMNANGAGVWGHIEASGTSITFGGGASYHAGLVGTLLSTASATVIQAGSYLSGCHVDTNVATSGFSNSGVYAAFSCVTGAGKQAWEHGLYIDGAESVIGVASASAYEDGVKIVDGEAGDAGVSGKVGYDALAKFMIGGTTYYIALFDADSVTGE